MVLTACCKQFVHVLVQVQLHTTFHYPPTPPVEGESSDKLHGGNGGDGQLIVSDVAMHGGEPAHVASHQQHFHSLPTPPTPELTATAALQHQMQNGGNGGEIQPVSQDSGASSSGGQVAVYGAGDASKQQLYQWQAGSNFCAVMGHPQFTPAATALPATRRPPPLYYQATEKTSAGSTAAITAQPGPLRSPMSEFVVMKECMDGEFFRPPAFI